MGILGIGVDIVKMSRIASVVIRRGERTLAYRILSHREAQNFQRLAQDVFSTPGEHEQETLHDALQLEEWLTKDSRWHRRIRYLGVRWAVKEAAFKAMNAVVRPAWKELTYESVGDWGNGPPRLLYQPEEEENAKRIGKLFVSVSHDGDYVMAQVLAETPNVLPMPDPPARPEPAQVPLAQRLLSRKSKRNAEFHRASSLEYEKP
ncbi:hypothetical protein NEOLEDRAFT_1131349 [Neolentinus lepideus HHB14362 ss-1]|uniref:4'-phosphopantetheinyl transferase domain-containing protein n=1 Tax=Neolentinus lepideus HHB14362 ss-1 TaxID=1314782 RepID=A0A165TM91_9AGAM|nr:hypothetical protein NEOLEDRAFT_1131349 [Neolentinus lepideus HHB14362 ss-1]